jgi:hypothetical protein
MPGCGWGGKSGRGGKNGTIFNVLCCNDQVNQFDLKWNTLKTLGKPITLGGFQKNK